ncbi:hypothetical protein [Marinicella sp. W31]|uniref:hypothetical protein n=1 Tax=Marinicella sp. W31 TaxID=3023713 RepID=UPI003756F62B
MNHVIQNILLYCHIGTGIVSVLSGGVALFSKKGYQRHVKFGRVFVWAMIISSIIGSLLGLMNYSEMFITFSAGVLAFTLIAGGVLTIKSKRTKPSRFELILAIINALNVMALMAVGTLAVIQYESVLFGFHAADYFFLGGMALICLLGDVVYFLGKRAEYHHKIARHLWRMCLGFFIAAGSAFTGPGKTVFPVSIQESGLLSLPEIIILLLMVFWLIRTLYFRKRSTISH